MNVKGIEPKKSIKKVCFWWLIIMNTQAHKLRYNAYIKKNNLIKKTTRLLSTVLKCYKHAYIRAKAGI